MFGPDRCNARVAGSSMKESKITASDIEALLRHRHSEDIFVPQCKTGPTHINNNLRILDAWVMPRSWAHWTTIGYEIKVSRSDFEHDQKWIEYLDYCHEFYFVCPPGLIKSTELPREIGLVWTTVNGTKLITKKRAEPREVSPQKIINLLSYVLIARSEVKRNGGGSKEGSMDYYREAVKRAEERQGLAEFVHGHIADTYSAMAKRAKEAERQIQEVETFVKRLKLLGIEWNPNGGWSSHDDAHREIDKLRSGIDRDFIRLLDNTSRQLDHVRDLAETILSKR